MRPRVLHLRHGLAALLVCLGLSVVAPARASAAPDLTLFPAANAAMPELAVPVGVRAEGMGEAYTAAGRDVTMLQWNPAGLARIGGYQLHLMHNEWSSVLGLRQEYLAYGMGLGQASGIGVSLNYFSFGSLLERASNGALGNESQAFAVAGSAGYGSSLLDGGRLKLGLAAEFGQESVFALGSTAFGGSLGALYDITRDFSVGASLLHLGTVTGGVGGAPGQADLGLAYSFNQRAAVLALDAGAPFAGTPTLRAGVEVNLGGLAIRGGWRQAMGAPEGDVTSGPTLGAGFRSGVFALDYAYVPYGDLSTVHRVSASIELPADFFKPKVIGAEASTITARSYFDQALAQEKQGNTLQALVQYQRVKDAYPDALVKAGNTQSFYQESLRRIDALQAEMAKAGNSEAVRREIAKNINDGKEAQQAGRLREAVGHLRDALRLDPTNAEAQSVLKDVQAVLVARKRAWIEEGEAAYDGGQINTAIQKYREVLALDPSDDEANGFFENHRGEILENLRRIHRKGIDLYISGHIRDAVNVWRDGLKLDPADPINYRRDIEKAEKVLEISSGH